MNGVALAPRQFRIRVHIAALTMACMALVAILLIGWGWIATRERLVVDAGQRAVQDSALLSEQVRLQLAPAQAALRQIASGHLPATTDEASRLHSVGTLLAALGSTPLAASAYVAYPNGDLLLARRLAQPGLRQQVGAPAGAAFLVQTISQQADGTRLGHFHYLDADARLLQAAPRPDYDFDPRTRPWYRLARQHPRDLQFTAPYRFATTQQLGVTLSEQATSGDAVAGIDVALDDLAQLLVALRATPGTRLALLQGAGHVVASTAPLQGPGRDQAPTLDAIDEPQLQQLLAGPHAPGTPRVLDIDGQQWIGLHTRMDIGHGGSFELMQAVPLDELSADARRRALDNIALGVGLSLLLLPLGWTAGRAIGRHLGSLQARSLRIARFDFSGGALPRSHIREVSELSLAIEHMGQTIEAFLNLTEKLATEPRMEQMLQQVLAELARATQSNGAAVYLWDASTSCMTHTARAGTLLRPLPTMFAYPPLPALHVELPPGSPHRHLDLELRGRQGDLQGLLALEFQADDAHSSAAFERFARRLSGMLAVAIETRQLVEAQRRLFDALIQLLADAIDAKSPYTGGHCERVPQMTIEFANRLEATEEGRYADFHMSDNEREAFRLGAWLHDCGKVTSPEHIVDKATKLEVIRNRIHEVRLRFEILWRDAELAAARGQSDTAQMQARQRQLQEDFAFVATCNLGGEFLADEAIARLHAIGAQTWQRHFDDRLGLSTAELRQLETMRPQAPPLPAETALLADLPEHRVHWGEDRPAVEAGDPRNTLGFDMKLPPCQQDIGELHNLGIRRGTLTDEDRFKINDHIVQTYIMLKDLPWPPGLERVPELAATHHERLDGKGYPRRLPGEQLGVLDRVMAMCDVFEALTAADRPYKKPKAMSETLKIMAAMCNEQHLDADLFRYFLHQGLWRDFAARFMTAGQQDAVDVDAVDAMLAAPAPR